MPRVSTTQKGVLLPFICRSCRAELRNAHTSNGTRHFGARRPSAVTAARSAGSYSQRFFSVTRQRLESLETHFNPDTETPPSEIATIIPDIRQRLRQWESENAHKFVAILEPLDVPKPGELCNTPQRQPSGQFQVDSQDADISPDGLQMSLFDKNDLVDVGSIRAFLVPGDLVELRQVGSQHVELAIFVRDLERQAQFYTMSGKWVHRVARSAPFFVPEFVQPQELNEIRPYLPQTDVPIELIDKLQTPALSVPRNVGKNLVCKMLDFWNKAELAYRAAADRIDNAHTILASKTFFKYATLEQIAEKLYLGSDVLNKGDVPYRAALYAIHRAILRQNPGLKLQKRGNIRAGGKYEICPATELHCISVSADRVRRYMHGMVEHPTIHDRPIHHFLSKARRLIDLSRKTRKFTPYGTIGPSLVEIQNGCDIRSGAVQEGFTKIDDTFIRFLESWCCLDSWDRYSPLSGIGSAILRATERYEGVALNAATAWTFLQEIGAIAPWESKVTYDLRVPKVGRRLQSGCMRPTSANYSKDKLKYLRKDWSELEVYCIDDASAHEIDDGVSVERGEASDDYWVHIHTADPAAHIPTEGPAADYARRMTDNIYLPERAISILDTTFVADELSLAPSRPCLTFSARLNLKGDLLETKVTAGVVRVVNFITPEVLNDVTQASPKKVPRAVYVVGKDVPKAQPSRAMLTKSQLTSSQKDDLRLLQTLANARGKKWRARGGISPNNVRPTVDISFNGLPWQPQTDNLNSFSYSGDPTIRMTIDEPSDSLSSGSPFVSTLMLLAGEVAANWCHDRGISIPYRITARNPHHEDLAAYFRKNVHPTLDEHGNPPQDVAMNWMHLIGGTQPSTTPGPHAVIGAELMTKCTSPLRRFGDLLVHWQIEAALIEEHQSKHSLIGNTREDFLPFSKAKLDSMLIHLDARERLIRSAEKDAVNYWQNMLLLRAWKFGEMELPKPLVAQVEHVHVQSGAASCFIEGLRIPFQYVPPEEEKVVKDGVEGPGKGWVLKRGQRFEIELVDMNVYQREISVKLLTKLEEAGKE